MEGSKTRIQRIIFIVVILLLIAGLATTLGIFSHKVKLFNQEMNAVYDNAYYQTLDGLGDIENKLKKVQVSNYNKTKKNLLQEVYVDTEVMVVNLARLNNDRFDATKVIKFINQLGGFSAYLAKKLPDENITKTENEKLLKLTEIVSKMETAFKEVQDKVAEGGSFYDALNQGLETLGGIYDAFDLTSVEYPEMIYDGPFSEGLIGRDAKFLEGQTEVSKEDSLEKIKVLFPDAEYEGEVSGAIPSYLYSTADGSVEVSKIGGRIVEIIRESQGGEITISKSQAIGAGKGFLENIGYVGLDAVWVSINEDTAYINYAFIENGIIHYPDLIKLKISLSSGEVIGMDAQNFLYNHTTRYYSESGADVNEISYKEGFEPIVKRRVIIHSEWGWEMESYEVAGSYDDAFYYIYYDLETLEEIKVMRVIQDENQGELIV